MHTRFHSDFKRLLNQGESCKLQKVWMLREKSSVAITHPRLRSPSRIYSVGVVTETDVIIETNRDKRVPLSSALTKVTFHKQVSNQQNISRSNADLTASHAQAQTVHTFFRQLGIPLPFLLSTKCRDRARRISSQTRN